MSRPAPRTPDCGHPNRPHAARGLCRPCWQRAKKDGTLHLHPTTPPKTPGAAVTHVSNLYGVTIPDLIGSSRQPEHVAARRAAAHGLWRLDLTHGEIGKWLGGRSASTAANLLARSAPPPPYDPPPLPDKAVCHVDGCGRHVDRCEGLCSGHRMRWLRDGDIRQNVPLRPIGIERVMEDPPGGHGTKQAYNQGGCRCEPCRRAAVRAVKLGRHRGRQSVPVDVGVAAIERLRKSGMSVPQIAAASGVMPNTLYGWLNRSCDVCYRSTVAKVEAVVPPPPACESCGEPSMAGGRWCRGCYLARSEPARRVSRGCGTDAGYTAHRRQGETPCDACRCAHAQAQSRRKAVPA